MLLRDLDRLQQLRIRHRATDQARPHRRLADPRRGIPQRQDRPAAARQANRAIAGNAAAQTRRKALRPPKAVVSRPLESSAKAAQYQWLGKSRCSSRLRVTPSTFFRMRQFGLSDAELPRVHAGH